MNTKAIFSFAIMLIFFSMALSIQESILSQKQSLDESYAIASSIENASFLRFSLESAFDSIFLESLEKGRNPAESKEIALSLSESFASRLKSNKKDVEFFVVSGNGRKEFSKESFSEILLSAEFSEAEGPKFAVIEITGGIFKDKTLSAKIFCGRVSEIFRLPIGYSAKVVK